MPSTTPRARPRRLHGPRRRGAGRADRGPLTWRSALAASLALPLAAFASISSPAVAQTLQRALEASAVNTARAGPYDAVIVLGGDDARVAAGAQLVLSGRARHLLYSGFLSPGAAAALRSELRALGLSDAQLVFELRSRDTHENAVESARIVAASPWRSLLLVTGAAHAKRAVGCFRRAGLAPDLYPVAFEADGSQRAPRWGWEARRQALAALHEWAGRVVYAAVGYAR